MSITSTPFGTHPDGSPVDLFTLDNSSGLRCRIMTLGGILTHLQVPDREGKNANVVLGFDTLEEYLKGHPHFGALTGRVAGRINGGEFTLNGKTYSLAKNDPPNHLHGGPVGIDKRNWQAEVLDSDPACPTLILKYFSPDGEMGYPGNLSLTVKYALTPDQALRIDYEAVTDAPTPVSLTNHSYFNLRGEGAPDLAGHEMQIFTDTYVPKLDDGTLTDRICPVEGTPHDFRSPKSLKAFTDLGEHGEHYVLRKQNHATPVPACVVTEEQSGRKMEVLTTTTAVQFYSAKTLGDSGLTGKSGKPYLNFGAFCLECQGYPNGVNCPEIDDIILQPGETYQQTTLYRFSTF